MMIHFIALTQSEYEDLLLSTISVIEDFRAQAAKPPNDPNVAIGRQRPKPV